MNQGSEIRLALNEDCFFRRFEHLRNSPHVVVSIDMPLHHVLSSFARKTMESVARTNRGSNAVSFDFVGFVVAVLWFREGKIGGGSRWTHDSGLIYLRSV